MTRDIFHIQAAIDVLDTAEPDYDAAAAQIGVTGLIEYGTNFSQPVFKKILQQHRPTTTT